MAHAHRHQRDCQWQPGQQVPRREPEAEHGRRHEGSHEQLRAERRGAQAGREQALSQAGQRPPQPLTMRAPQPPESREGQREHRRPAQQPVLAVEEERDEPVGTLQIAARKVRISGALAGRPRCVGGGTAVERLVECHVERDGEERQLDGAHGERPALRSPERAHGHRADHHARRHEFRAEPRQCAEQREAQERIKANGALVQAQGQQRRRRQSRARGELRVDGAAVRQERRAEPDRDGGTERPGVGRHAQRKPVRQRHRERSDRGDEQLHALRATDRICGADQKRKAEPVWLVQPSLGPAPLAPERVWIEVGIGALGVLVAHIHVAVLDDRPGGEQIVRLVAAVLRAAERVQAQRRRVGGEQEQPEGEGATHRRRTLATRTYETTAISSW